MVSKRDTVVDIQQRRTSEPKPDTISGHKEVLEYLFNAHGSALRAYLLGRMGTSSDVDDVQQEVFVRLARMDGLKERLMDGHKGGRSFIYTTANNLIVDLERRKAVRRRYLETEGAQIKEQQYEIAPDVVVEKAQELERVEDAILCLPQSQRKAFVLSRFKHLSYQEIGKIMGVSERSVEKYISQALVKLRCDVDRSKGDRS